MRSLLLASVFSLLSPLAMAQGADAGKLTSPNVPYGYEILGGGAHAKSGNDAGGGGGGGQGRTVLRRHGAETMPEDSFEGVKGRAGQGFSDDRPNPPSPQGPSRLLSAQGQNERGGQEGQNRRRGFGAERQYEGSERLRLNVRPSQDANTTSRPATTPRPAPRAPNPPAGNPPAGNTPANTTPANTTRANTPPATPATNTPALTRPTSAPRPAAAGFAQSAHAAFSRPPTLSPATEQRLNALTPTQQARYAQSIQEIAQTNRNRAPTEAEVDILIRAALR